MKERLRQAGARIFCMNRAEQCMDKMAKGIIAAVGACVLLAGSALAQTNGFVPISDSYTVQYPANVTLSQRFTVTNGLYTCWCYGTDAPAAQASGTDTRTEMRWQTWPNQTVANQFSFDEQFSAGTQNTCIHQIKSDNKGDGSGGEAIYVQVNQPGTLRNSVGANFASGIANTWFHINSIYDPVTGHGELYFNGSLVYSTTSYGPYPNGNWYFKTGAYDNGMPTNAEAWVQISNVVHLVQSSGFQLSVTPVSQTMNSGQSTNYTLTVTTNSTFTGSVAFGITGLPSDATASFVPSTLGANGNSTMTIQTTTNTPGGGYVLTIEATNGGYVATTNVTLLLNGVVANLGTLLWSSGSGSDTNWSTVLNWTNISYGGFGPPGPVNSVQFTNIAAVNSPGIVNNVVNGNITVASLQYDNNAANTSPNYQTTLINSGQALVVTNGLVAGTATDAGTSQVVNAAITGAGGTLILSNGIFAVTQGSGADGAHQSILDLSGLDTFEAVGISRLGVAVYQLPAQTGNGGQRSSGILYLAKTNFISVTSTGVTNGILVGWNDSQGNGNNFGVPNAADQTSALYLGQTNVFFTGAIYVGTDKTLGCLLAFNPNGLNNPTAYIRGVGGAASRVSLWGIGDTSMKNGSNQSASGTNDFTGGTVDALVGNMTVGVTQTGASGGNTGNGTGVLTFNAGTIDVNYLTNGWSMGTGTNGSDSGTGTVNVNDAATLKVNHVLALGRNTSTGGGIPSGTLSINGGTVIANSIIAGIGTSAIVLNGGALVLTNAAGTPGTAIGAFACTNSTLHLNLNGASVVTNIVVTNLIASGLNTIAIDSAANIGSAVTFPLVSYTSFNGSVAADFTKGALPAGFSASLVDNSAQNRIDLVIAPSTTVTPRISAFSLSGATLYFNGSNGLPKGNYYVLTSTNVALPLSQWTPIATNQFDNTGNFNFSNMINPNLPGQFYQLQIP
jgi:hypothetical protein